MKLKELLVNVEVLEASADFDMEIGSVACDSRKVEPGSLFVAVSGFVRDGNSFIPMAMEKGAVAVVTTQKPEQNIPYVLVASDRLALARIGTNFYGHPAQTMTMVGVTGTNGKTSTTWILKQVIEEVTGKKVGLIGSTANYIGQQMMKTDRTTPESLTLQGIFAQMRDAGCSYVVMEVSSHALALERVAGVEFDLACFTNLTQDHLDFHITMEEYCDAKGILFSHCRKAVVTADDPWTERIIKDCKSPVLTTGVKKDADLRAVGVEMSADGIRFVAVCGEQSVPVTVPIPGNFTVYNALSVLAGAMQLGISLEDAARVLSHVKPVKGRVEVVPTPGKDYTVLIDFAHTPDGLENVLISARKFCKGRLIAVFGCGGDRDRGKRPIMADLGVKLADIAVITTDNPRGEIPDAIIEEMLPGLGDADNYAVIVNRREAIHYAMDIAQKDDVIVLAGKGHETFQDIMGVKVHFDEREVVAEYIAAQK